MNKVIEDGLKVRLVGLGIGCLAENVEDDRVEDEAERREAGTFLYDVAFESLLALALLEEVLEELLETFLTVEGGDDILHIGSVLHDVRSVLIDLSECLGFVGHVLRDVTAREHGLEVDPHGLSLEPLGDDVS